MIECQEMCIRTVITKLLESLHGMDIVEVTMIYFLCNCNVTICALDLKSFVQSVIKLSNG